MENVKIEKKLSCNIKQYGEEDDRVLRFIVTDESQDSDEDILLFEGWNLERFVKNPVGLYMHQYDKPAMAKAVNIIKDEMHRTIMIDFKFPSFEEMSSDERFVSDWAKLTDTVYNLYKNGYMNAVSVGFDSNDYMKNPNSQYGRIYKNKSMLEVSFVSVPANENALLTAKSKGIIDDEGVKAMNKYQELEIIEKDIEEKEIKEVEKIEEVKEIKKELDKEVLTEEKTIKAGNALNVKNRENLLNIINMLNSALSIAGSMMENYQEPVREELIQDSKQKKEIDIEEPEEVFKIDGLEIIGD